MKNKSIYTLIFICAFLCFSCKKSSSCKYITPPPSMILKITKGGQIVIDGVLTNTKLSYISGGIKKYLSDFTISNDTSYQHKGLIASRDIGTLSADNNIKIFFIEYPNNWLIDTLYVNFLPHSPTTNCLYVEQSVKQNGFETSIDNGFAFDSKVHNIFKP